MDILSYKTAAGRTQDLHPDWVVVDASGLIVGRLATQVAMRLRGKHKPTYSPHLPCGDKVIILNAEKIRLTGKKMDDKEYISHSGYPGGQKSRSPREVLGKRPEAILEAAVRGMLPKNRLGRELFRNLYVYAGNEHPHEAQSPQSIQIAK